MRNLLRVTLLLCVAAQGGCRVAPDAATDVRRAEPAPYLTLDELATTLSGDAERRLVLVEFCVPSSCSRCDQMRGPVDRLASSPPAGLAVRRMDLRRHPQLAWEFKISTCPSYIAFRDGEEVFRAAYPTSADLIAARLEEVLAGAPAEQVASANP